MCLLCNCPKISSLSLASIAEAQTTASVTHQPKTGANSLSERESMSRFLFHRVFCSSASLCTWNMPPKDS